MRALPENYQVAGNKECLELAEELVKEIKKGRTKYLGFVRCEGPGFADAQYGGMVGCEFAANWGYDLLKRALMPSFSSASAAPNHLDLSYACYDLRRAPISFDIIPWIIDREMSRIRSGAPAPLKVAFTAPADDRPLTPGNRLMLEAVLMPIVSMIGVIDPVAATAWNRAEYYCNRPVVEAAQRGETVPLLTPSAFGVKQAEKIVNGLPPVTITLREIADYDTPRNSRTEDWLRFAKFLQDAGERVIIVRDTRFAAEPLAGFETCPEASRNVHVRLALYERAKTNFFVSNGPVTLGMFSEAPFIFINEVSDHADSSNKTESWAVYHGTPPGEQLPWSRPDQRIVWADETYETMRAAWDDFVAMKQAA